MQLPALAAGTAVSLIAVVLTLGPGGGGTTPTAGILRPVEQRTTSAATDRVVKMRLRRAVSELPTAREGRRGYDRDKFRHWIDADGDCQDTRDEVLDAESVTEASGCDITTGEWRSYYDGEVWTDSSDVDIDHLVPLAEAWYSGARRWTAGTRTRYTWSLADGLPAD